MEAGWRLIYGKLLSGLFKNKNYYYDFWINSHIDNLWTCGFVIGSIKYIIEELRIEKKDSDYKKYINRIKIGDTFELNIVKDLPEDPFDSNSLNHTEYQCVITDIKKNTKGETWVKYKNLSNEEENTEEIYTFAERRNQIC